MRVRYFALLCACISVLSASNAAAQDEPTATGLWQQVDDKTGNTDGWFLIFEHNGFYEGAIAKMFIPPGKNQNPICSKCEGDQKNKPTLGLVIIKNMQRNGMSYENGTILDPRDGSVYHAIMQLSSDGNDLTVRGYIGIPLLGRNQIWHRLSNAELAQIDCSIIAAHAPVLLPATCRAKSAPAQRRAPVRRAPAR